jgi:hypothetical protein
MKNRACSPAGSAPRDAAARRDPGVGDAEDLVLVGGELVVGGGEDGVGGKRRPTQSGPCLAASRADPDRGEVDPASRWHRARSTSRSNQICRCPAPPLLPCFLCRAASHETALSAMAEPPSSPFVGTTWDTDPARGWSIRPEEGGSGGVDRNNTSRRTSGGERRGESRRGEGTRMARVSGWLGFLRSCLCVGSAARGRCRWASTERSVGRQILRYDWLLGCAWLLFSLINLFQLLLKKDYKSLIFSLYRTHACILRWRVMFT